MSRSTSRSRAVSRPPSPESPRWPRLERPQHDRVLAGVCTAVARSTGTDPVLWRVLLGVLAVFGGSGLLLYAAGYLLIPEEGRSESIAERTVRTKGSDLSGPATIAIVAVAALVLAGWLGDGAGLVPVLVIGTLAYLVWRKRGGSGNRPTPTPTYGPTP